MGSYSNQTTLVYPDWFKSEHFIRVAGIDNCLVGEIKDLWNRGIQTTASCCGHNIVPAVISVIPEHIEKMEALGYEHFCDPTFGPARTHFKPKSVEFCMYKATHNGYPI